MRKWAFLAKKSQGEHGGSHGGDARARSPGPCWPQLDDERSFWVQRKATSGFQGEERHLVGFLKDPFGCCGENGFYEDRSRRDQFGAAAGVQARDASGLELS